MGKHHFILWSIFVNLILCHWAQASFLQQKPRAYKNYPAFNNSTNCHSLKEPLRKRLAELSAQGHKMVMVLTGGAKFKLSPYRIKDEINGRVHASITTYVDDLKVHIEDRLQPRNYQEVLDQARRCLHGYRLDKRLSRLQCVTKNNVLYLHGGFIIMDPHLYHEPFIVHFYGDEKYRFLKPSIRVETFDSYFKESNLKLCQAQLITLKKKAEKNVFDFLRQDHSRKLLATGDKSYNVVAHPWGLNTQNCNIWMSEVLASSLYLHPSDWSKTNRRTSKLILSKNSFRPVKLPLTDLQTLARLPALFIGGFNTEEGNVDHELGVVDIVPMLSIYEWLVRKKWILTSQTIYGEL